VTGQTQYQRHSDPAKKQSSKRLLLVVFVLLVLAVGFNLVKDSTSTVPQTNQEKSSQEKVTSINTSSNQESTISKQATSTPCSSSAVTQNIIVSINQQHLWACQGKSLEYSSAVVTGAEPVGDGTPLGVYHIYAKYTNQVLRGCDSTGCWNDPVSYWMPFLPGPDGPYGIHDATWRSPTEFGNINPQSDTGSHGCVEMPLTAAQWIYDWAPVGTAVTVES
jgi:lipoprotein-anchoring transpeptidase ErfK/SrfK